MSIPGCTTGEHTDVDDAPKQAVKANGAREEIPLAQPQAQKSGEKEPGRAPVSEKVVGGSLAAAMTAQPPQRGSTPQPQLEEDSDDDSMREELVEGSTCKRRNCNHSFSKSISRENVKCVFHPGIPIFHEGSKGWTCCKRRVLEFEEFLKIEGCKERVGHCYIGKRERQREKEKREQREKGEGQEEMLEDASVRNDFYQTPGSIIVSFYLKKIVKEKAKIYFDGDGRTVRLDLPTSDGKRYKSDVLLWGEIEPRACKYRVLGTKLELTLVKSGEGQVGWPVLRSTDRDTGERIQVGRAGRA